MLRIALILVLLGASACAPVLDRQFMDQGAREFRLSHLAETPEVFQGKLFVLGGVIAETRVTERGSEVQAIFAPVDSYGYLKSPGHYQGRFIAFYPRRQGLLDPLVYAKGREITLAAEFRELRKGKIDEMDYSFPVFEIRQIYLWDIRPEVYYAPRHPYGAYPWGYDPWYYDPWWGRRPYPGPPPPWW